MKNVRHFRGLALTSLASLGLFAVAPAFAASNIDITAPYSVSNNLNFSVTIPQFLSFRVGTAGATVDLVDFVLTPAQVGTTTDIARTNNSGAAIPVQLVSNGGDVSIAAVGTGTGLVGGGNSIPWTEIDGTSSDNALFPVPAVGASVTLTAGATNVISRTADWTFVYDNSNVVAATTYTGTVTYTATDL